MTNQQPPTKAGLPIIHNLLQYKRAPLDFWREAGLQAPIVHIRLGPRQLWLVTHPDYCGHILQTKARNYHRSTTITGDRGLLQLETVFTAPTWDDWLWRRRLLQPAFHRQQLTSFASTIVAETKQLLNSWPLGQPLSLKNAMKTLTMRIIGRTMFSAPLPQTNTLQQNFEQISQYSFYVASSILPLPTWLPIPLYQRTRHAVNQRTQIISQIVHDRLASGQPQDDLLDMLIAANLDDGTHFESQHIIDEMISIIFAGHETTAMTLTWLFAILAHNPDIEQKLRQEIRTTLGQRPVTLDDLPNLPYLTQLINETLRYYPAAYLTLRQALEDDQLGPYHVPAGTELIINIRGLHHHPTYWPQPHQFNPDRFTPDQIASRPKNSYLPFITGPRKCIGDSFALMEMQLVVPTILQHLTFNPTTAFPQPIAGFVMEPDGSIPLIPQPAPQH
ncbi:MAG TPA: cytochrome P450 [Anaerolineae bacterium]|nr:cytochrome P450 [Anaerolineae bacterium]